jgi:multiple sugar transport system substrate-binding protein
MTRGARAAALALVVASARVSVAEPVTLRVWAMGREGEVLRELVPDFERAHAGVRVRVQQIPWSAAHEKLLTAFVGGALPDVFQVGNTWLPELAALDAVEPLDGAAAAIAGDVFPGILDTNVVDGHTWGVPWYADTRLLFYRDDLARAAGVRASPATWSEWVDALVRVAGRAGPDGAAILLPLQEWQTPVILALQGGARLLRADDTCGDFTSPPARRAFTFYVDLFRRGLARRDAATQLTNVYQDFAAGRFTFYVTGPWNLEEFGRRLPPALAHAWRTAPMPSPEAGTPGLSLAGGASLVVSRSSPQPALARALVAFLVDPASLCRLHELAGDLPARRSAWARCGIGRDERTAAFWTQLQTVQATPKIPEWERIATRIAQRLEFAVRGDLALDDALAALDRDVDTILEKRRWLKTAGGTSGGCERAPPKVEPSP